MQAAIIPDYQEPNDVNDGLSADADGDGVSDSIWVKLPDIYTAEGRPIFAAVRIIDNAAMINVNTAFLFDPNETDPGRIDGSSQMQINLMALSWRPLDPCDSYEPSEETDLLDARAGGEDPNDLDAYEYYVIWPLSEPSKPYTPFDISDELELRYRFLLNHPDIDTRLEPWGGEFRRNCVDQVPFDSNSRLNEWFRSVCDDGSLDPNYAYRHLATTCNIDRVIDPNGCKMVNINTADVSSIYSALVAAFSIADTNTIDPNAIDPNEIAARLAVNIVDFRDDDANVTFFPNDGTVTTASRPSHLSVKSDSR
ncbi:hypothetical protein ES707_06787 [subsurface metagenome]